MLAPLNYIVIEDQVIHHSGSFQPVAGGTKTYFQEATGATYRLEADQALNHPVGNNPSATVENCGGDLAESNSSIDVVISIQCYLFEVALTKG